MQDASSTYGTDSLSEMKGETNSAIREVRITTPARLHFSLIDLNGQLGRIDGGFGLAINEPNFKIVAEPATEIHVESDAYQKRACEILTHLQTIYQFPGIKLKLISEIPTHSGFGSGTQLSLAIATAVNVLYDLKLSLLELATAVGRGGTSGIGVAAFDSGGFIVDVGHQYPEQKASFLPSSAADDISPPPILFQQSFPNWQLLIAIPNCSRIYGEEELNLFRTLCPQPPSVAPKLTHILLLQILPALLENNMHQFSKALNHIQTFGWKKVEIDAQGDELKQTLEFMQNNGALGGGVSSWGPAICAVSEDIVELKRKTEMFLSTLPNGGTCFITSANNTGAEIKIVD
ncbi:MAG: beta-ribofuranosylaminobenzene 5'-phosphate synthase [Candidatus Poribacteria bacterium]|nr:beta-ribofuranosylaminobenzene 5'-phosphate synthase [Candidatus Poribacteria bacterium]